MAGMIPPGLRFLDVGCGEGTLGETLSRACRAEFVGVESDAARAARSGAECNRKRALAAGAAFPSGEE